MLFMRYYIYSCKLHEKAIILGDFVNKLIKIQNRKTLENTKNRAPANLHNSLAPRITLKMISVFILALSPQYMS